MKTNGKGACPAGSGTAEIIRETFDIILRTDAHLRFNENQGDIFRIIFQPMDPVFRNLSGNADSCY